jgi:hypothetical protein
MHRPLPKSLRLYLQRVTDLLRLFRDLHIQSIRFLRARVFLVLPMWEALWQQLLQQRRLFSQNLFV